MANGYLNLNPTTTKNLIDKTQNSICGTVVKNETVNIRIWILLLALKMKWSVQCSASDYTRHRYTPLNSMELRTLLSLRKSFSQCTKSCGCTACKTLAYSLQSSVIHSRQLLQLRAHTLMCFVGLFPLIKFPQTHSRTRQCNLQVLASRVYGNATCKFELPKLGKIYKLSKFVLRGY